MEQAASALDRKTTEQPELAKKLKALGRKFSRYLDQAARGAISLDELRATGGELVRERQFLEQRLTILEAEARGEITAEQRRGYVVNALENLQERWEAMTFTARRALLQYTIDRIVVYDDHIEPLLRL